MAYQESDNTALEKDNFSSPCRSQVAGEIVDCPVENHINCTTSSIPLWNHEQYQLEAPNFAISKERLAKLVEDNDVRSLHQFGGIYAVAAALETNIDTGICGEDKDLRRRHEALGSNLNFEGKPPITTSKGFYQLTLDAFRNTTVILLLCCATLSLVLGIKRNGPEEGLLDGVIIFLAIFIVVNVGVISNFCKATRIFKKRSGEKHVIGVIRNGRMQQIAVSEVVVGDIVCLQIGDRVPADGLFIHGESLKLDDDLFHEDFDHLKFPSMFTGAKVLGGDCRMLVTSVGKNTERSKMMRLVCCDQSEESKLEIAIDKLNSRLEKIWLSLSLLVLVVQVLRCFIRKSECDDESHDPNPTSVKNMVEEIMNEGTKIIKKQGGRVNGLVALLCILLFSVRDGLPLGIFISFLYASKKMMSYQAMVQKLPACATIGLVSTICTGKTGDLSLHHMKMGELWIGLDAVKEVSTGVAHEVLNALREGVGMIASGPAEDDLLCWAQQGLGVDMEELKRRCTILHTEAFDLNRNRSGISLRRSEENDKVVVHVHWKGAPEIVLSMCSHYYNKDGTMQTLDEQKRVVFEKIIEGIAADSSPCIAFAYKQVVEDEKEEPLKLEEEEEDGDDEEKPTKLIENGLILLGLVGLKNPYAPEVRQAVEACRGYDVNIKLVVGCDLKTARFMAINSGILRPEEDINGAVVDASEFRNSSEEDRMNMIDNIRVMANTSPSDKLLMVQCLRQKGEVVAVTGTCTRDSPSLKEADLGILLGDSGAEVAKENSDVVILDLNFETFSAILKLGRCVCNNIQKFIQLQLTLNIAAFTINFIVALSSSEVPLAPFQLLWVNLIMDILGALALAVSVAEPPPSRIQLESRQPAHGAGPLTAKTMWRNITVQALYQVTICLTLHFKGRAILHADQTVTNAMIFNCYALCQVFVLINAREIEKANVFEGMMMHENRLFPAMVGAIVILQVAVIEIEMVVTQTARLDMEQWCICTGVAAISLPIGWAAKWISFPKQAF